MACHSMEYVPFAWFPQQSRLPCMLLSPSCSFIGTYFPLRAMSQSFGFPSPLSLSLPLLLLLLEKFSFLVRIYVRVLNVSLVYYSHYFEKLVVFPSRSFAISAPPWIFLNAAHGRWCGSWDRRTRRNVPCGYNQDAYASPCTSWTAGTFLSCSTIELGASWEIGPSLYTPHGYGKRQKRFRTLPEYGFYMMVRCIAGLRNLCYKIE